MVHLPTLKVNFTSFEDCFAVRQNFRAPCLSALTKCALKEDVDLDAEAEIAMVEAIEPSALNKSSGNISSFAPVALEAVMDAIDCASRLDRLRGARSVRSFLKER